MSLIFKFQFFWENSKDIRKHETGTMVWWAGNNSWIIKSDDLVIATDLFLEERPPNVDELIFMIQINKIKLSDDPRFWFPEKITKLSASFGISGEMRAGDYDVFLRFW